MFLYSNGLPHKGQFTNPNIYLLYQDGYRSEALPNLEASCHVNPPKASLILQPFNFPPHFGHLSKLSLQPFPAFQVTT